MKTLLWREYGFNRHILIAGVVILLIPYVYTLIFLLWPHHRSMTIHDVGQGFAIAAVCSYSISQLTVALLAGYAIAGERADRSAEFLAYLPISRGNRLASKLILTALVTLLIWVINLAVLWGIKYPLSWTTDDISQDFFDPTYTLLTGLMLFGVSWFLSSIQSSPSIAVIGGVVTPILVLMGLLTSVEIYETQTRRNIDDASIMATWYMGISLTLAILGFTVGTWYFLKRVEP